MCSARRGRTSAGHHDWEVLAGLSHGAYLDGDGSIVALSLELPSSCHRQVLAARRLLALLQGSRKCLKSRVVGHGEPQGIAASRRPFQVGSCKC
jgi:hypothetical protein